MQVREACIFLKSLFPDACLYFFAFKSFEKSRRWWVLCTNDIPINSRKTYNFWTLFSITFEGFENKVKAWLNTSISSLKYACTKLKYYHCGEIRKRKKQINFLFIVKIIIRCLCVCFKFEKEWVLIFKIT